MIDKNRVEDIKLEQRVNLNNLCYSYTPPTPDEILEIRKDNKRLTEFFGDYRNLLYLCEKFKLCDVCRRTNKTSSYVHCKEGCYLESLGLITHPPLPNKNGLSQDEYDFRCKTYWGSQSNAKCVGQLITNIGFSLSHLLLKDSKTSSLAKQLDEEKGYLEEERKVFEEKKRKLGRPSKLNSRRMLYEINWVQADPKPTYKALAKLIGISVGQVHNDLRDLGLLKGDIQSDSPKNKGQ